MATVALVGAAHIHTPGFVKRIKGRDDMTVRYVWDHDTDRAKANADQLGAQVEELKAIWADDQIQAVVICSETNRHEDLVMGATEAGKHLFVEKPLGMGSTDAYRMAEAIKQAGLIFQTGYFMRSNPANRFIRQQIEAGALGQITRLRGSNCHSGSLGRWFDTEWRWMADPAQAGCGAFGDLGTHALDILLWWAGQVSQCTADINVVVGNYDDCDESGEGLLKFANGATATLAAGWVDVADPVKFLVSGTKGHVAVIQGQVYFQSELVEGADGKSPWTDLPEALPHAFELFCDAINGGDQSVLVTVDEATARSSVMEALYQGAAQRTWITPK